MYIYIYIKINKTKIKKKEKTQANYSNNKELIVNTENELQENIRRDLREQFANAPLLVRVQIRGNFQYNSLKKNTQ